MKEKSTVFNRTW